MNGKTWARGAALTIIATVVVTNCVGCAPTTTTPSTVTVAPADPKSNVTEGINWAWGQIGVDDQMTICAGYAANPGIITSALVTQVTSMTTTVKDWSKLLNAKCN